MNVIEMMAGCRLTFAGCGSCRIEQVQSGIFDEGLLNVRTKTLQDGRTVEYGCLQTGKFTSIGLATVTGVYIYELAGTFMETLKRIIKDGLLNDLRINRTFDSGGIHYSSCAEQQLV